jgi:NADH:ubiquinone oxidoreductase subunit E
MLFKGEYFLTVTICIGSSCHLKGSRDVIRILERLVSLHHLENQVTLQGSFCMGECTKNGVCVKVDDNMFSVTPTSVEEFFENQILKKVNQ